jgi:hypothetical protein
MDRVAKEVVAFEAFTKWLNAGRECRALFESARLPLPDPLSRFLGEETPARTAVETKVVVPPPETPPRPAEWQEGWIWVPAREATVATLVRAILRRENMRMTPKAIAEAVDKIKDEVSHGTIANIGTRLTKAEQIERADGAWKLINPHTAPVLHDGYVWGDMASMDDEDIAKHRRILMVHVLRAQPDGLQIIQLTRAMETCEWVRTPLSKDLVKTDLHTLAETGKVKRVGNAGKWRAAPAGEEIM